MKMKKNIESTPSSRKRFSYFIMFFAGLGGLLYGYDIGVISGALEFLQKDIKLTENELSLIVGAVLYGGAVSILITGPLADLFGRKKIIIFAAVIFIAGVLMLATANSYHMVLCGRLILGVGIGAVTIVLPLYLAESAPANLRGRSVTMFQLFLTGGILLAYVIDMAFTPSGNWRGMFICVMVPGIILLIGAFALPESPCWLFMKGKKEEVLNILHLTRSDEEAARELAEMATVINDNKHDKPSIWRPFVIIPMAIAFAVAVLTQLTGINVLLQYAPLVIKATGLESNIMAMLGTIGIGLMNFIITCIVISLIDKAGRKVLLTIGTAGIVVAMMLAGCVEYFLPSGAIKGYALIFSLILYVLFFAIGPGVVVWLAISEILPTFIRSKWMGVCLFANSLTSAVLASSFEPLVSKISYSGIFWLLGGCSFLYFLIAKFALPETKGKTLIEIEEDFRQGKSGDSEHILNSPKM
jgi:sugar porter (SP) family MFS transporter